MSERVEGLLRHCRSLQSSPSPSAAVELLPPLSEARLSQARPRVWGVFALLAGAGTSNLCTSRRCPEPGSGTPLMAFSGTRGTSWHRAW